MSQVTCWHPPPSCPEEQEETRRLLEMLETALVDQRCWRVEQRLLESALRQGEELITLFILPSRACVAVLM